MRADEEPVEIQESEGEFVLVRETTLYTQSGAALRWPMKLLVKSYSAFFKFAPIKGKIFKRDATFTASSGRRFNSTHYYPSFLDGIAGPTILIRTPYNREMFIEIGCRFASHGYHVIIQTCAKTFTENYTELPLEGESQDGMDTLTWIKRQDFCNGSIGMWGPSYLGLVQYSLIDQCKAEGFHSLKAIVPMNCASSMHSVIYPSGVLHLDLMVLWLYIMLKLQDEDVSNFRKFKRALRTGSMKSRAFQFLPICELDTHLFKTAYPFVKSLLDGHVQTHDLWKQRMRSPLCNFQNSPPISLVAGWYDCFLRPSLEDICEIQQGQVPYHITFGPWNHFDLMQLSVGINEALAWFDVHLRGNPSKYRLPVSVYIIGLNLWAEFAYFPPKESRLMTHFMHPDLTLNTRPSTIKALNCFTYDPEDPTPSIGGNSFDISNSGRVCQDAVDKRKDVLTYTSPRLLAPLYMIGRVSAELWVNTSNINSHFCVRLNIIEPNGKSYVICDGLSRVANGELRDGAIKLQVDMCASAVMFPINSRIRVVISSAAHPRWLRSLGTDNDLTAKIPGKPIDQIIIFDTASARAPCVFLPIVEESSISLKDR